MITTRGSTPSTSNPSSAEVMRLGRRHQLREPNVESRWGRLTPVGKSRLAADRPAVTDTRTPDGERLAAYLQRELGEQAVILGDRRVGARRGAIDFVVVAASGVWLIDAKADAGMVEGRDIGGWFNIDYRLYVGGRDRTGLLAALQGKLDTVKSALGESEPVHGALCLTGATWKIFAKPCQTGSLWITWADALVKRIATSGQLTSNDVVRLAVKLDETLSPANRAQQSLAS